MSTLLLEARPFRPFKSSEEYLIAMKEDLAEWLQTMYPHLNIQVENFMEKLETGVALCEHANAVKHQATEYVEKKQAKRIMTRSVTSSLAQAQALIRIADVKYFSTAKPGTFFARDNVSNFIKWCRTSLEIIECLLFESDDLIMRKNEKHVILCLLEVARRGAKFGMLAPMLVQMERQIDREIAADQKKLGVNDGSNSHSELEDDSDSDMEDEEPVLMYGPIPQIVTNDLKSLDEMSSGNSGSEHFVRDLVEKCTCPTQFPMIRVSEGKYRIGDTKVLIFVRILRNHVMVRVGGGWDTLSHYLDKHDPCRCRSQHRTTQGARLVNKPGAPDLHGSHVYYDRTSSATSSPYGPNSTHSSHSLGPPMNSINRSRSRSPSHFYYSPDSRRSVSPNFPRKTLGPPVSRSRSPTPNFTSTQFTKLSTTSSSKHHKNGSPLASSPNTSPIHQAKYINGGKNQSQHVTSLQIPLPESKVMKSEATLQVGDPLTDHSDTTSEMSDEGYRSLGVIQDKNKQRSSLYSQNSVEDVEENEHHTDGIDDLNDFGLRKTQFSQRIYENSDVLAKRKPQPSCEREREKSDVSKNASPIARSISCERQPPRTSAPPPALPPQSAKKSSDSQNSKINTWNGRQKQHRPSLQMDTYVSPFARNSNTRRSVSAVPHERRASSANTSPTKGKLRQELLNAVKRNDDDAAIVQQVQELLKKYSSMNALDDDDYDLPKFNRNGERMSVRSPRKDSKPDNHLSRIPAPVLHKA